MRGQDPRIHALRQLSKLTAQPHNNQVIAALSLRHSRAGGNPEPKACRPKSCMDSRLRGNDDAGLKEYFMILKVSLCRLL